MATKQALMAEEGKSGQATFEKNGEKVIFELEPKNVGLTKDQLEKYRNDPFWKPVRTILFALFWLSWLAMFAGAILIVVLSPKCAEKQKPEWWQTKVSYQVRTPTCHRPVFAVTQPSNNSPLKRSRRKPPINQLINLRFVELIDADERPVVHGVRDI
ncbi:hypothetical protein COOONC_15963 [Cooperia oncophora]